MPTDHMLDDSLIHQAWDNAIAPRLTIDAGDTVTIRTRDASNNYYSKDSTAFDVANKGPFKGHALTGPVFVRDAAPGDVLSVELVAMKPGRDYGWTAIMPGRGLLPEADFGDPFLQIWDLSDGRLARMPQRRDIAVPIAMFPGVMGTALAEPGAHSTMPPRRTGGNMDIKHLTVGATAYIPIEVEGALFSTGDAHAAQGDGEVCVTAIETWSEVTMRFGLKTDAGFAEPQFHTHGPFVAGPGGYYVTTAQGPDLYANAQNATRYMIDHLVRERGLSREEAYVLCSVCVDLKISEIVDAPNWLVSAFLPEAVFV